MRRLVIWTAGVALFLVVALVATSVYAVFTVRRSFPQYGGELVLPGLSAPVEVVRDRYGVPQLYADTAEDLFRAQGYVHAQDRFWEMDFRRHLTAGRLAELFGEKQVPNDRLIRTLGWRRVAERELALLHPSTRRYLRAYADGVNAWMRNRSGAEMSLEHGLLGLTNRDYAPAPWEPADSLAWLKAMAWDLRGNMPAEIERARLRQVLPRARVEQLYPPYPFDQQRPILTAVGNLDGLLESAGAGAGSNAWAVSGEHTASGRPLLANDPHLAPALPSVWYQVGLHCRTVDDRCPFDVTGFSFSGLPGVVIGHNADVAWGFANLGADVTDLYLESVQGDTYLTPEGRKPLAMRRETIRVAGGDDITFTVRSTRNGPLISDVLGNVRRAGGGFSVALRWTALEPGRTADTLFGLARASDWPSFRQALSLASAPAQSVVYADVEGNIGYAATGRIPIRRSGDGRYPVPGWIDRYAWEGYIPADQLPSQLNPDDGLVIAANQAVVGPDYPHLITTDWLPGYRSERIRRLLQGRDGLTTKDMQRVQVDDQHPLAPMLLPRLLAVPGLTGYRGAGQEVLRSWDGRQSADSPGAAYFNAVWRELLARTFHDELPRSTWPDGSERWGEVMRRLLERPRDPFWDDARTEDQVETRDDILRESMVAARDEMTRLMAKRPGEWAWGRVHTLKLRHATYGRSGIGFVEWLFNRGPYETSGSRGAVNATGWTASQGYRVDWVPSMRMVVDLADLDASRWVNLTGASGHPFHPNYVDQVELWRDGELTPMRFAESSVRDAAEHTLVLRPGETQP